MKKIFFAGLISLAIFSGCQKSSKSEPNINCATVNCIGANPYLFIRFYDKTTDSDLIATNVIDTSKVKAWNQNNEALYNYAKNMAGIDSLKSSVVYADWPKGINTSNTMYVKIKEGSIIQIDYNYKYTPSGCCGTGLVQNINVPGYSFSAIPIANFPANYRIVKIKL